MTTATELKTQILTKADEDNEFRARLLTDPKAAISTELGTAIPEGFNVLVHEDSATRRTWCCRPRRHCRRPS